MRPKVFGIVVAWNQPFLDRANFEPFFIPWIVPLILLNSTYSWDQYHPYSLWQIHLHPILRLHWYQVHGKFYLLFLQLHPKMTVICSLNYSNQLFAIVMQAGGKLSQKHSLKPLLLPILLFLNATHCGYVRNFLPIRFDEVLCYFSRLKFTKTIKNSSFRKTELFFKKLISRKLLEFPHCVYTNSKAQWNRLLMSKNSSYFCIYMKWQKTSKL